MGARRKVFFFFPLWKSGKVGVEPKPLGNALAVWSDHLCALIPLACLGHPF